MDARYWDRDFETRPWPWIESWQAQQLASMLETLPQRSELYRDVLGPAGRRTGLRGYWVRRGRLPTLDMLELLPLTTRDQLRDAQVDPPAGRPLGLQQAVPQEYIVQVVASAGTTGTPVLAGLTRHDQEAWGDAIANALWTAGIRPDDLVVHLAGQPLGASGWPVADGLRRLGATVAWLGAHTPGQARARLAQLRASAAVAPTALAIALAERGLAETGNGLGKLLGTGEPGLSLPEVRDQLVEGWGVGHVRDTMGVAEVMACLWAECDEARGMHFTAAKHVIVELVEPRTGARLDLKEGAAGEAVYTTFDRDATPVLRYRSGDLLQVVATGCACGRTSPRVRPLGRLCVEQNSTHDG